MSIVLYSRGQSFVYGFTYTVTWKLSFPTTSFSRTQSRFITFKVLAVDMNSLAFSIGNYTPRNLSTPNTTLLIKNLDTTKASTIKFSSHHLENFSQQPQLKETQSVFNRREAIGLGFCASFLDVLLQQELPAKAEEAPCELTVAPSGLAFCDKIVGTGPEAVKGQLIKAHYVGKLESGKIFDSSYNRGKPLTFRVGVGEVIRGWDQGILGGDGIPPMLAALFSLMDFRGKRKLKLPPELAYGVRGAGCKGGSCIIPPDSVLLFDVEFIGKFEMIPLDGIKICVTLRMNSFEGCI
ncbi:unnamed protein product [Dovyalis caffra]|uniref:peptidylprolyl isomerase n=1 Tax=Dovyalis caffra TaxID=77055 RepID=A0AAV1RH52_9ROSI|nr:unnamed protein product [Dovyalis caffra]